MEEQKKEQEINVSAIRVSNCTLLNSSLNIASEITQIPILFSELTIFKEADAKDLVAHKASATRELFWWFSGQQLYHLLTA